jgi:tetratricopeptide (TPR) repeat protein
MHLPGVGVSTELAVQRMAGGRLTHAEIAKRLGADVVVTTDAARTANGIALTFAVSSPSRSPTVRRTTVSGTLQQLIDWRDSLAGTVMTLAGQRPDPDALKAATQHRIATSVPQAYSEYARVMRLTRADTRQDRASFHEVLAREDTLLAFDPRFIDALSDRGMFTLNGMEYYHNEMSADEVAATIKESREFLRRAQAVDPTHPLTERLAGYLLLTSGDTAGAQRAFTAASQAEPVFQLIADLCSVEIDQTPPPAPVPESCQRLAEADTLNPIAMSFAGYLFANNGRTEEALAAYRRSSRLEPTVARYHVVAAYALRAVQRYDEALQELHQAAALDPRDPEIHHAMFHLLQTIEHPEEALTEARAVVDAQPRDMNSLGELSSVLTRTGHHSESIATSRKAVTLSPGNPAAHEALARSLWGAEQFEPALKEFRSAVDLDASQSDRWIGYSSLLRLSGRTAEAQAALDRLKLLSGGPNAYLKANADLMEWIGRADAASEAFRRAVNGDSLRAEHWNSLAYAEILAGRPDSAIVACRRALALDSTRASVYSNLALAMSLTGHGKEAIAASDNLRRYGPYDQAGIAQQIWFYHRGGRQAEAAAKLDSLERRMSTYAPSLLPKLIAYTGIGDTARARQTLAETVKRRDLGWREFSLDDPLFAPLRGTPEFLEAKRQFIQQGDRAR